MKRVREIEKETKSLDGEEEKERKRKIEKHRDIERDIERRQRDIERGRMIQR